MWNFVGMSLTITSTGDVIFDISIPEKFTVIEDVIHRTRELSKM